MQLLLKALLEAGLLLGVELVVAVVAAADGLVFPLEHGFAAWLAAMAVPFFCCFLATSRGGLTYELST